MTGQRIGFWLYLVTDGVFETRSGRISLRTPLEGRLSAALSAVPKGTVAVQLRARGTDGAPLLAAAERLRQLTRRFAAPLFINDRLDIALIVEADGVHLPAQGLPPKAARRLCGDRLCIGASTHSVTEARVAVNGGADFITYGPIWPTPSKPSLDVTAFPPARGATLVSPVGIEGLREAVVSLPVPVFALGGVDSEERARLCIAEGARVACLRAVLGADDPAAAARSLMEAICSLDAPPAAAPPRER